MQPSLVLCALASALTTLPVQVLQVGGRTSGQGRAARSGVQTMALAERARVEELVVAAVGSSLPAGWQLQKASLASGGQLPANALEGPLTADVRFVRDMRAGSQPISVLVSDGLGRSVTVAASVTLVAPQVAAACEIKRGEQVMVTARTGSVLVQTRGVAQSAATMGATLVVLCDNATRTLTATVVGPKAVEVRL